MKLSDHISHLRLVHFSIVIVSFALLLGMMVDRERVLLNSLKDIEGIIRLVERIRAKPELIFTRALERAREDNVQRSVSSRSHDQKFNVNLIGHPEKPNIGLEVIYPEVVVDPNNFFKVKSSKTIYIGNRDQILHIDAPKTLGQFKTFWNAYNSTHYGYVYMHSENKDENKFNAFLFSSKPPLSIKEKLDFFYDDPVRKLTSLIKWPKAMKKIKSKLDFDIDTTKIIQRVKLQPRPLTNDQELARHCVLSESWDVHIPKSSHYAANR